MLFRESETIELKEIVADEIKKEIIAFANCDGGKLYIGVQDDGTVVGLDDPDGVSLQISNMVRDAIKPDVLKKRRQELGLTQEELAKKLGVNQKNISKYESGKAYPKKRNAAENSNEIRCVVRLDDEHFKPRKFSSKFTIRYSYRII